MMALRVVSAKVTEEEHTALLEACNDQGLTPSSFIKAAILDRLKPAAKAGGLEGTSATSSTMDETPTEKEQSSLKTPESEIIKFMRLCKTQKAEAR